MKKLSAIALSTFAALLAACSSGGLSYNIESADLEGIPASRRAELAKLSEAVETARAEQNKAEKDLALAEYELEKAEQNRDLLEDRMEHMEGLRDAAETLGDAVRIQDADHVITGLDSLLDAHEAELDWLEAEVEYYEVGVELAESKVETADAQLMEARASAIHQADLPSKAEFPLQDFKIQVSEKMAATASLATTSAKAWQEVQDEKRAFQEALADVPDDESAERKALAAEANKNREMADEMNALRKQIIRLRNDNQRLQTTLATQDAGGGDDPVLTPGGGAVTAGSSTGEDADD